MIINNNIPALNTYRQMGINQGGAQKAMEKLSSGLRINRAGDDAAGLAISEKMRAQIRGLDQASRNSQDGISMIQTAEGALQETQNILQRMRELATQASNDTNVEVDRNEIQKEINQLTSEINRVGNTTEFNTRRLLNGDLSSSYEVSPSITTPGEVANVVKAIDQTIAVGDEPVSWSGTSSADFEIGITGQADNGFDFGALNTGETNELVITRDGDAFKVDFEGTDGSGSTLAITADSVAFDPATKTYSYDNQGISFSFTQEDIENWEDGDAVTIDLNVIADANANDATGTHSSVAEKTPLTIGGTTGDASATMSDIDVDGDSSLLLEGVDSFEIEWDEATATFTATLLAGGTQVSETTFSLAAGDTLNYDADGISFTFTATGDTDGDGNITGSFSLETDTFEVETKEEEVEAAVVEDRSLSFQIGANQNQALKLAINDMRSESLGVSSTGDTTQWVEISRGHESLIEAGTMITGDDAVAEGLDADKFYVQATFTSGNDVTDGTNAAGVERGLSMESHESAAAAVTIINDAIERVSAERSMLGATQNRLEHTISNLNNSSENLQAAESRVRDVDMAREVMEMTKNNILSQASQAMLAQANQAPQAVLQLLG
ncbi:flagellin N-terminal helical domain-containing protein [Halalkalibacter oceani]|uniref:flagellin N-terminal helical domain-containing protein n=1 Tax=Halalkalibacter oceani TaxID=1653776 RepID=UPI0033920FE0